MDFVKTVSLSEFRVRYSAVIEDVHANREPVLITKRGKPVARLVAAGKPAKFIGRLNGALRSSETSNHRSFRQMLGTS
jgi:prevent-host-death family protein